MTAAYPPRRSIRGHHPDCPYPRQGPVDTCNVCQGIRKAVGDHQEPSWAGPSVRTTNTDRQAPQGHVKERNR